MVWSNSSAAVRSRRRSSRLSTPTPQCYSTVEDRGERNDEELHTVLSSIEKGICTSAKAVTAHHYRKQLSLPLLLLPIETPLSLFKGAVLEGAKRLSTSLLSISWEQAQSASEQDAFRSSQPQHHLFDEASEGHLQQHQVDQNHVPLLSLGAPFAEVEENVLPILVLPHPKLVPCDLSRCGNYNLQHYPQKKSHFPLFNSDIVTDYQQKFTNTMSQNSISEAVSANGMAATTSSADAPQHDEMTAVGVGMVANDVSPLQENSHDGASHGLPSSTERGCPEQRTGPTSNPFRSPSFSRRSVVNMQTKTASTVDGGIRNEIVIPVSSGGRGLQVYPPFLFSELVLGKKIGSGGFCVVQDILEVRLTNENHDISQQTNNDQQQLIHLLRDEVAKTCVDRNRRPAASIAREGTPPNKFVAAVAKLVSAPPVLHRKLGTPSSPSHLSYNYVIKMLRHDLPEEEMRKGVMDMAIESNYLQTLSHPNIISLKGIADVEALDNRANFFLVVEKLQCTLDVRLKEWRLEVGRAKMGYCCFPFGLLCPDQHRLHILWEERFVAARDVASAIEYLHSHRIVYRDLKPENIGFDATQNQVKIFDFGLAKTLPSIDGGSSRSISTIAGGSVCGSVAGVLDQETGMYHLTGNTGSLRYMAPEVALNQPYDQRVDAYSFGILFWQICALSIPYGGYSCKMHADLVVRQGYRPKVYPTWPPHWGLLMRECWAGDVHVRPDFTRIIEVLTQQLDDMQGSSFSPTFKHRKVKAEKVGKGGQSLDADSRLGVQLGNEGDMDMVRLSRNSLSDSQKGVSNNDVDFLNPDLRVV